MKDNSIINPISETFSLKTDRNSIDKNKELAYEEFEQELENMRNKNGRNNSDNQ